MSSPVNNTNNECINQNQSQLQTSTAPSTLASIATATQQSAASALNLPQSNTTASVQQPQAPIPPVRSSIPSMTMEVSFEIPGFGTVVSQQTVRLRLDFNSLNNILTANPNDPEARLQRGAIHLSQSRNLQALEDYSAAYRLNPSERARQGILNCFPMKFTVKESV